MKKTVLLLFVSILISLAYCFPVLAIGGPPCNTPTVIFLDNATYSANINSTFTVVITQDGGDGCSSQIQDDTGGSWAIVPASGDVQLNCGGTTCSGTGSTVTKTLQCDGPGTYSIRAYYDGTHYSSTSTVTCIPVTVIRGAVINNAAIR